MMTVAADRSGEKRELAEEVMRSMKPCMRAIVRWSVTLLSSIVLAASPLMAQAGSSIPDHLRAKFPERRQFADTFHPESNIDAPVWYDTDGKYVAVWWLYRVGGAKSEKLEKLDVSFNPTAVAPEVPKSKVVYVAGYIPRTDQTIIERWDFAVGTGQGNPVGGGGSSVPLLVRGNDDREVILSTTGMGPIKFMFYSKTQERLVFVDDETDLMWAINPETGEWGTFEVRQHVLPQPFKDRLQGYHSVECYRSPTKGFFVVLDARPAWLWLDPTYIGPGAAAEADSKMIMQDVDQDGVFETILEDVSAETVQSQFFDDFTPGVLTYD